MQKNHQEQTEKQKLEQLAQKLIHPETTQAKQTKDTQQLKLQDNYILQQSNNLKQAQKRFKIAIISVISLILIGITATVIGKSSENTNKAEIITSKAQDKSKIAQTDAEEQSKRNQIENEQAQKAIQTDQSHQSEITIQNTNPNITIPQEIAQMPAPQQYQLPNQSNQTPQLPPAPQYTAEDKEIDSKIKEGIYNQAKNILEQQHSGYSQIHYAQANKPNNQNNPNTTNINQNNQSNTNKPTTLIYKAGDTLYATLNTSIDTDDSKTAIATIYGGKYDQATIIGQINQTPNNINIIFTQLSPKDRTKKSININAIAIREQDAKQGVAQSTDHHTLERYSYLFTASLLKAIGTAAQGATQSIIGPGGAILNTQEKVTEPREIAKQGLGEVGTTMGQEIKRKFNRPPTYKIPANQGIGILFLQDIEEI